MKRLFISLAAISALLFTACSNQPTLYQKGTELVKQLQILAGSEEYLSASMGNYMMEASAGMMNQIAGLDADVPEAVYAVSGLGEAMAARHLGEPQPGPDIMAILSEKLPASLPAQMSAAAGVETLAAVSVLNAGDSFIHKGLEAPVTYVYLYGVDYGVMVSFTPHGDGVVSASAGVFFQEQVTGARSAQELTAVLEEQMELAGLRIEEVAN